MKIELILIPSSRIRSVGRRSAQIHGGGGGEIGYTGSVHASKRLKLGLRTCEQSLNDASDTVEDKKRSK